MVGAIFTIEMVLSLKSAKMRSSTIAIGQTILV